MWGFTFAGQGGRALGTIRGGCMDGEPFFMEMKVGSGRLVLLGATPVGDSGEALLQWILRRYIGLSGVTREAVPSEGVEIVERTNENGMALIAVNMDKIPGTVAWQGKTFSLEPFATKIITDNTETI